MSDDPRPEDLSTEGEGDSLGEAKWAAMKELEPRFPGITAESVSFEVIEEPEGGGLARVRAEVDEEAWREAAEVIPEEPGERVRAIVARVVHALGLRATVDIVETEAADCGDAIERAREATRSTGPQFMSNVA